MDILTSIRNPSQALAIRSKGTDYAPNAQKRSWDSLLKIDKRSIFVLKWTAGSDRARNLSRVFSANCPIGTSLFPPSLPQMEPMGE